MQYYLTESSSLIKRINIREKKKRNRENIILSKIERNRYIDFVLYSVIDTLKWFDKGYLSYNH